MGGGGETVRRSGREGRQQKAFRTDGPVPPAILHIHGQRDRMIRAARATPDLMVPNGSRLINLSHAEQVNDFIRDVLASLR
jgi:hypothetical protein